MKLESSDQQTVNNGLNATSLLTTYRLPLATTHPHTHIHTYTHTQPNMEGEQPEQRPQPPQPQVFRAPRLVSRPKPRLEQEEEMGNEIKLGDFEDVHALSVSEARAVVTAVHEARKKKDPENNPLRDRIYNDNQTITHFLDYLENFSRYKQEESLHSIAALFDTHPELTTVEKALLGT
ncbi:HRDC-like protein [Phaeosphaeriaceae sp. PMI808]|nr:HRDC-like protein [Phaeosphaeriaceae sp. PMI808]